jgi:hypothetical protein
MGEGTSFNGWGRGGEGVPGVFALLMIEFLEKKAEGHLAFNLHAT